MRREYSRIAGVESVDTRITGAVVKLKVGNKASLEHFWTIADKLSTEHVVWYAPAVKRMVKYTVSTSVGSSVREATTIELMEFKLN